MLRFILAAAALLVLVLAASIWFAGSGRLGELEKAGEPVPRARANEGVARRIEVQRATAREVGADANKQILFGDLHVHTTFSADAFLFSLPLAVGEGAHPPADACDFARHCSALDFWSINDHAESLSTDHWHQTVDSIRQCNAVAGDGANPDTVALLGWEWTQAGPTPETHYGHKNVILPSTDADVVPARPISAAAGIGPGFLARALGALSLGGRYADYAAYSADRARIVNCPEGVPSPELPPDCREVAATPEDLYRKLDERNSRALVIPHGTTWGLYTPQGSSWDKQLAGGMHDPKRQTLIEIFSGHGDSEVLRDWRAVEIGTDGEFQCPAPRADYEPVCWRAGEIIRERCLDEGLDDSECDARAAEARLYSARAGSAPHAVVPGGQWSEFGDSGQCLDCERPAFNYRPGGSAQYILALSNFDTPGDESPAGSPETPPRRFRMGFIASSDNHFARPGTGFKERHRSGNTESQTPSENTGMAAALLPQPEEKESRARPLDLANWKLGDFSRSDIERIGSYLYTGGLVAAHSRGRNREAIWDALERREVYATSGPRILLWFDLLNAPDGRERPMGSEALMHEPPRFRVRAAGSFEQKAGCPRESIEALGSERLAGLCKDECYWPSDRRRPITRIDVIRIRPQRRPGEPLETLVEDPWRSFPCEPSAAGCSVEFEDPEYARAGRDTLYYVRVAEAPRAEINGDGLQRGADLNWQRCPGSEGKADDCLGEAEPRAWSSPIWVDWTGS